MALSALNRRRRLVSFLLEWTKLQTGRLVLGHCRKFRQQLSVEQAAQDGLWKRRERRRKRGTDHAYLLAAAVAAAAVLRTGAAGEEKSRGSRASPTEAPRPRAQKWIAATGLRPRDLSRCCPGRGERALMVTEAQAPGEDRSWRRGLGSALIPGRRSGRRRKKDAPRTRNGRGQNPPRSHVPRRQRSASCVQQAL